MTNNSQREKLIKQMKKEIYDHQGNSYINERDVKFAEDLTDWILADRARIVEPLVKLKKYWKEKNDWPSNGAEIIIDEAITLALGGSHD